MWKDLTKGDIRWHIKTIAIPAVIGFFFNTLYNITDTFFAWLLSTEALASLGLSFPVFFIIIAFWSGIWTWVTALISNSIWEKNIKKTKLYSFQAISFSLIVAILLTIIWFILSPFMFQLLWAEWQYLELALSYMNIIVFWTVFFILVFTVNSILNAYGDTKSFRNYLIFWFFLNLALNPILMFWWLWLPSMWISGIWLATVLIEILWCVYLIYKASKLEAFSIKITYKEFIPNKNIFLDILKQWWPASLNMMTIALWIFIITYFIAPFWKEAVAAYWIATRVEQLLLLPMIGLNIAALAMVWQNNWAKKTKRVLSVIKITLFYWVLVAVFATILLLLFWSYFISLFSDDINVINIWTKYLFIAAFITWTYVIMFLLVSILQWLKKPLFVVFIWIYRQIFAPILIFWLLVNIFKLQIYWIWYGILIINWTWAIITIIYFIYATKNIINSNKLKKNL